MEDDFSKEQIVSDLAFIIEKLDEIGEHLAAVYLAHALDALRHSMAEPSDSVIGVQQTATTQDASTCSSLP